MSWIRTIHEDSAEGRLAEVYRDIEKKRGKLSNIMRVQRLRQEPSRADRSDREGVLAAYALELTRSPGEVQEADVEHLRSAGFSDEEILQTNMIAAYFNFVNRIAEGLGVTVSAEEAQGYRY